ncbi:MAG: DHHA1 domain-containing protein, partial [Bacilli bacterium]|nr:DHHA1 domain-containing protein [Bacilli bacterium]
TIVGDDFEVEITDVIKAPHKQHLQFGNIKGVAKIGDIVKASIDVARREDIAKNHSATHLLQEALREGLSSDIEQAGSKVNVNGLRFDFTYQGEISDQEMVLVEQLVNEKIATKVDTVIEMMSLEEAKKKNAICLFEDKYEGEVRVVTLYDAIELCGGTHVKNLGDIKAFAIKSFESKGSNVYRIEATTDKYIESELYTIIEPYNGEMLKLLAKAKKIVTQAHGEGISLDFNVHIDNSAPAAYADIVYNRLEVANVREKVKELEKAYISAKEQKALQDLSSFDDEIFEASIGKCLVSKTSDYEVSFLKQLANRLLEKMGKGIVFIANVTNGNVNYIAKAHKDIEDKIDCGALVKEASDKSSGNGGGSKLFGQGGGTDISKLDEVLEDIKSKLK